MKIKLSLSSLETRENPSASPFAANANLSDYDVLYFEGPCYIGFADPNPQSDFPAGTVPYASPTNEPLGSGGDITPDFMSGTSDTNPTAPDDLSVLPPLYTTPDAATLPDGN